MKKILLTLMLFTLLALLSAVQWRVDLVDSYGDGWNGGTLTVLVNGSAVLTGITLPNGTGPLAYYFDVVNNDQITTDYTAGSWSYENEYYIYDHNDILIASQGAGDTVPLDITTPIIVVAPVGAPGNPINPSPANASLGVAQSGTLSWDFGADTATYDLWFGPAGNMTEVVTGAAAGASGSYAYSGLLDFSLYNWQIIAHNANRMTTNGPVWSFTTTGAPIATFPYAEAFEGTFLPGGWSKIVTAGNDITQSNTQNHTTGGIYSCRFSSYSTSANYNQYLFSRPVSVSADFTRLSFWHRKYNSTAEVLEWGIGTDTNPASYTWTPVTLSETVWQQTIVDISAYAGQTVYIAFHYYGDYLYYVYLDDVTIDAFPLAPIFTLDPAVSNWDFGQVPVNNAATKQFTITNTGAGNLILSSVNVTGTYYTLSVPPADTDLTAYESTTLTVQYLPTAEGGPYTGQLVINDNRATTTVDLTGTAYAPSTLPLSEGFEAGFGDWIVVNGTQTNQWYTGTATAYTGTQSAYISNDAGVSNAYDIAATSVVHLYQDIAFDADCLNFPLSFWWKGYGESSYWDYLQVFLVDTSVTPVAGTRLTTGQIGVNYNLQSVWNQANITIPGTESGLTKRLVFSWWNDSSGGTQPPIAVDDISLTATPLPTDPIFSVVPAAKDFGQVLLNTTATQEFVISNQGGGTLTISDIALDPSSHAYYTLAAVPAFPVNLGFMETTTFTVQYAPTVEGGPYTGTVNITDNRLITPVALTGTCFDSSISYPDLPYSTSFEDTWVGTPAAPLPGWTVVNGNLDSYTWRRGATYISAHTGSWFAQGMGNTNDYLITPPINTGASLYLKWWDAVESPSYPNSYKVMVSTTDNQPASFTTELADITCASTTWTEHSLTINNTSGTIYIAFYQYATGSTVWDFGIDDLLLQEIPAGPPTAPTLTYPLEQVNMPAVGFNLTWTPDPSSGPTDYYVVYFWEDGQEIGDGPIWSTVAASLNPTNPPLDPFGDPQTPIVFGYMDRWNWTVEAYSDAYPQAGAFAIPSWFQIQSDPTVPLPYAQDFGIDATPVFPLNWTQTFSGGVTSNRWTCTASALAGGTANEMTCAWASGVGITRLITPPLSTTGITTVSVSFKHYYNDYGPGVTGKVQYSYNLTTWYDAPWSIIGGAGDQSGTVTTIITGLNSPVTYVAWVFDGDHYQFDYWYVDDVLISEPLAYDVGVASIDLNQVYAAEPITLKATIANYGVNPVTFNVAIAIDTWTSTYTGLTLAAGASQQITFPSQFTPVANTIYGVTVTTLLATDENTANDTMEGVLICLPLDMMAFADVAYDPGAVNNGPATFNLKTPGTITDLPALPSHTDFMPGADWMGGWYGNNYGTTDFWNMDASGAMTSVGTTIAAFNGIAYNPNANVWYGATSTELYTFDPFLGTQTLIGTLHWEGETTWPGLMIGLAYDSFFDVLYGIDLGYDAVVSISTTDATVLDGYLLGIDINYAQDCAFDQTNGLIYLAGYTTSGALYWVHPMYGAFKVGDFQSGAELTGFAIPYSLGIAAPEVTIGFDGTLSWTAIDGANSYKVYGSDNPYGPFTLLGSTALTSWSDPNFPEMKKFYQVVASSDARRNQNVQLNGLNRLSSKRLDRNKVTPINSGVFNPRSK